MLTGLVLSLITTGSLLITEWLGGEMAYRQRVGVADPTREEEEAEHYRKAA